MMLKRRAIALLATGALAATLAMPVMTHADGILLQDPNRADFQSSPGVPECTSFAGLRGDLSKGAGTLMVRMRPGCVVPFHWHTPSEEIVILQGAPLAQMLGERPVMLKVGSYSQLPSKHVHRFRCTSKVDCVLFLVADAAFDIHFVDDSGKEISTEDALKAAATAGADW
jgi:quercetin dioxygenase-like cupin family protein